MSDLLEEIFAALLDERYGEKDRSVASTMARLARLAIPMALERKRRKSSAPYLPEAAQEGAGAAPIPRSPAAPADLPDKSEYNRAVHGGLVSSATNALGAEERNRFDEMPPTPAFLDRIVPR